MKTENKVNLQMVHFLILVNKYNFLTVEIIKFMK